MEELILSFIPLSISKPFNGSRRFADQGKESKFMKMNLKLINHENEHSRP